MVVSFFFGVKLEKFFKKIGLLMMSCIFFFLNSFLFEDGFLYVVGMSGVFFIWVMVMVFFFSGMFFDVFVLFGKILIICFFFRSLIGVLMLFGFGFL